MIAINNDIESVKGVTDLYINIDMVNGFLKEGVLAAPNIMEIVPRQEEILDKVLDLPDSAIAFIRDSHKANATEFRTYPTHCLEKTRESEVIDELKYFENYALEYLKNSTNLMFAKGFMEDLKRLKNLERIYLMGCLSEVCVLNGAIGLKTYFDEANKNVDVYVFEDAIDTFDSKDHNHMEVTKNALNMMEQNGILIRERKLY